jgi:hypothetical protein
LDTTTSIPAELGERGVDDGADLRGVGDVQGAGPEPVAVLGGQVGELLGTAQGRCDAVAPGQQLLGQLAADPPGRSGDEPGSHGSITRVRAALINDEERYARQAQPVDRSGVELRQLEYALAVAEELHFGRAAARMHVTQQSVSEQVRRLERELGAPLFTRTSRRVALTSLGEAFLPEARQVVRAAAHALDAGRHAAQGRSGEVRSATPTRSPRRWSGWHRRGWPSGRRAPGWRRSR